MTCHLPETISFLATVFRALELSPTHSLLHDQETFQPEVPRYAITEHAVAHITIITATLSLSVYVPLRAQKIIHHMVMPDA